MKPDTRERTLKRLRRIEGQVGGIQRMVETDRYCVDVLLQIAAVRAALDKAGKVILEAHVQTCVADAMKSGSQKQRDEKIAELMKIFSRYTHI